MVQCSTRFNDKFWTFTTLRTLTKDESQTAESRMSETTTQTLTHTGNVYREKKDESEHPSIKKHDIPDSYSLVNLHKGPVIVK